MNVKDASHDLPTSPELLLSLVHNQKTTLKVKLYGWYWFVDVSNAIKIKTGESPSLGVKLAYCDGESFFVFLFIIFSAVSGSLFFNKIFDEMKT